MVNWQPPATSPDTVVNYEVSDAAGGVVCAASALACTVTDLPDGEHIFTVRARNAQGEGNALPASVSAVTTAPTQMAPPTVTKKKIKFRTLAGTTSAVVGQYRVVDVKGRRICTIKDFNPNARSLSCPLPKKTGTYRFRVIGVTQMGQTPHSGMSRKVRIS